MKQQPAKKIGFLAFDGMQTLDLFGPLETFQEANEQVGGRRRLYENLIITRDGSSVTSSSGVRIDAHASTANCPPLHTLIIIGGEGARVSDFPEDVLFWIKKQERRVLRIGSICTGFFILAQTGLLDGLNATTHWHHVREACDKFPAIHIDADALFLRHGKIFTAAGVTAGIDMALALIEEDFGPSAAALIARHLVVFFKRPGDQRQYSSLLHHQTKAPNKFGNLAAWIKENLTGNLSSAVLAERVGLSERQFRRRFLDIFGETPTKHIERIRLETACEWLVAGSLTIDQIAQHAGFRSADTFRRAFERLLGVTPSEYRSRFHEGKT